MSGNIFTDTDPFDKDRDFDPDDKIKQLEQQLSEAKAEVKLLKKNFSASVKSNDEVTQSLMDERKENQHLKKKIELADKLIVHATTPWPSSSIMFKRWYELIKEYRALEQDESDDN